MVGTEAEFITRAGFAEEVSANWFTNNIYRKDGPAVFSHETKEVVWFMGFQLGSFFGNTEFKAKWIGPDGNVYTEQVFKNLPENWDHAITALPVRGTPASALIGKWKIEVYHKDALIAKRIFEIT